MNADIVAIKSLHFESGSKCMTNFCLQMVVIQSVLTLFAQNSQHMPILRCFFTAYGHSKTRFYDVIANELYLDIVPYRRLRLFS